MFREDVPAQEVHEDVDRQEADHIDDVDPEMLQGQGKDEEEGREVCPKNADASAAFHK